MNRMYLSVATTVLVLAVQAPDSYGQQLRRYQPARPTVSPYINLLRRDVGPVPNYYSLVRPQINQLEFNQQQVAQQAQQAASLRLLESEAQKAATVSPTGKSSWFMTTGRSSFMNTSRFYPAAPGGGRR